MRSSPGGKLADAVTHVFVSRDLLDDDSEGWSDGERRAALRQLSELQEYGVPCFYDNLIVDFLTGLEPKAQDYAVACVGKATRHGRCDKRKEPASSSAAVEHHVKKTRMTLLQPSH